MAREIIQIARFGAVGILNTVVGGAVIVLLDSGLGVPRAIANAAGYAVGLVMGYMLNRGFVFRSGAALPATRLRYLTAFAVAFGLNQGALVWAGISFGEGAFPHMAAQLVAMAVYSVVLYVTCRFWVFRQPGAAAE